MVHFALPFDARWTLEETRRHLSRARLWTDPEDPDHRRWYESRLQAGLDPDEVDALHERRLRETRIVVRRISFATIFWYSYSALDFLERLEAWQWSDDAPLAAVLDLHETDAGPVEELSGDADRDAADLRGVVVEGSRLIGVAEPGDRSDISGSPSPSFAGEELPPPRRGDSGWVRSKGLPSPDELEELEEEGEDGGGGGGVVGPAPPPPRTIEGYPDIGAPDRVEAGATFDVVVGLAAAPVSGVSHDGAVRFEAAPDRDSTHVDVRVVADGFTAPGGWSEVLRVRHDDPYDASVRVRLKAGPVPETGDPEVDIHLSTILVEFSVGGALRGVGRRPIAVVPEGSDELPAPDLRGSNWLELPDEPPPVRLGGPMAPVDLEVTLAKPDGNPASGRYVMTLRTPHTVALPEDELVVDVGTSAETFASTLIEELRFHAGNALASFVIGSHAASMREVLPDAFWEVLGAVTEAVEESRPGSVPSILWYSAEPWIPWELTLLEDPPDPERPPFLAAQYRMGRWLVNGRGETTPPESQVDVRLLAALAGKYNIQSGLKALPHAETEVRELTDAYGGIPLPAEVAHVAALLGARLERDGGETGVEVVHFAAHGLVDPKNPASAKLYLNDGLPLSATLFRRTPLGERHHPFLFLNACMVGTGGELLGEAGGFPGMCIKGGFRGLLAPLWAVDDEVASELARTFYERAFGTGGGPETLGGILRDLRARYGDETVGDVEPTCLAYVFYGHPDLVLQPGWSA